MSACVHVTYKPVHTYRYIRTQRTSVHPYIHPSIRPTVQPFNRPTVQPSIRPSAHPYPYLQQDLITSGEGSGGDQWHVPCSKSTYRLKSSINRAPFFRSWATDALVQISVDAGLSWFDAQGIKRVWQFKVERALSSKGVRESRVARGHRSRILPS